MTHKNSTNDNSEVKKNAVLLTQEPGRSVRDVAEKLSIHPELIYRWRRQMRDGGELSFPGHGRESLIEEQLQNNSIHLIVITNYTKPTLSRFTSFSQS